MSSDPLQDAPNRLSNAKGTSTPSKTNSTILEDFDSGEDRRSASIGNATRPSALTTLSAAKLNAMSQDSREAVPQASSQAAPQTTVLGPNPTIDNISSNILPEEFMGSLDTWIRKYQHLPAPQPPVTDEDRLAGWAALPDKERTKAIDDMICRCLEDENFIKLAEEIEGHWKRIGLGN